MDKKNKIIKDLVHEYVEIDEKIQKIVDTKEFQRLKRVKQLTAIYIYPSANHTRFEHSLGVMKLAMDYYTSIEEKLRGIVTKNVVKEDIESRLQYYKVNLQIAALLHDLGHAPFSHLGEKFFDKEEIKNKIKATLKEEEANSILDGNEGAPHELMSCFCIKKLESKLKEIYGSDYDYEFICRIITGKLYSESEKDWKVKNVMINIVNSDSIDVDKLDYILRDNHMCGYPTAKIDLYRFFRAVELGEYKESEIALYFNPSGVPVIQSIIDSRDSLYLWVYNHHLAVYTDSLIAKIIDTLSNDEKSQLFSPEAIAEKLVSDEDLQYILKQKFHESLSENKALLSQLFNRKLLKPIWKTVYKYEEFVKNKVNTESKSIIKGDKVNDKNLSEALETIEKKLLEEFGSHEKLIIAERANKFYYKGKTPEVKIKFKDGSEKCISELLPQKKYEEFSNIAFYVFLDDGIDQDDVEAKLVELLKATK
ncbi:MAG: HD domain-containing protein [Cetobacterium sp.]|uniref:HD domain-containing protein n=1 Tax=Cetobacterium sp. TaxID=2071632 RepID=UPI003F35D70E